MCSFYTKIYQWSNLNSSAEQPLGSDFMFKCQVFLVWIFSKNNTIIDNMGNIIVSLWCYEIFRKYNLQIYQISLGIE